MNYRDARMQMVEEQLISRGIRSSQVLNVMRKVPRHLFVEELSQAEAYDDHPILIGEGQTISQPYMVALMTEVLDVQSAHRVLEIGTGSGYQTAILAELASEVYTVERIASLATQARQRFERMDYANIRVRLGDGTLGWDAFAPYERILVTAGAPSLPARLSEQLADGGILVIPIGNRISQALQVITKQEGRLHTSTSCHCVFVRLIGQEGWEY